MFEKKMKEVLFSIKNGNYSRKERSFSQKEIIQIRLKAIGLGTIL